jgi:ABC-type transporter Mla MlaB component
MQPITLDLTTIDGNAFAILSAFKRQAKKEGWTLEEINEVLKEAMSGDYNHLLQTIMKNIE